MIFAHDTFTYANPKDDLTGIDVAGDLKRLWKCQDKSPEYLYSKGVRGFDIRLIRKNGKWMPSHGIVYFPDITWNTIDEACEYIESLGTSSDPTFYRVVFEASTTTVGILTALKTDSGDWDQFKTEASDLCSRHPNCWTVLKKTGDGKTSNWLDDGLCNNISSLVSRGYKWAQYSAWASPNHEYNVAPSASSLSDLLNDATFNIKDEATKNNPNPTTQEMLRSKEYLYSMDYCDMYIQEPYTPPIMTNEKILTYDDLNAIKTITIPAGENKRCPKTSVVKSLGFTVSDRTNDQLVTKSSVS